MRRGLKYKKRAIKEYGDVKLQKLSPMRRGLKYRRLPGLPHVLDRFRNYPR